MHYWPDPLKDPPTPHPPPPFFSKSLFLADFQNDRFHSNKDFTSGTAGREVANFSALSRASLRIYTGVSLKDAPSHISSFTRGVGGDRWEFASNPQHRRSNTSRSCDSTFTSVVTCKLNCTCLTFQSVLFLFFFPAVCLQIRLLLPTVKKKRKEEREKSE